MELQQSMFLAALAAGVAAQVRPIAAAKAHLLVVVAAVAAVRGRAFSNKPTV
ncbi:hypothetical protein [Pantoea agglomerans]|uniref:hypothetical protein n=1 Tax=Enterobacter agglomerans TaxID=549 RepID=UPI003207D55A